MPDVALLRRYSESGSEDAFAALVSGCLPLVYGAALRRVGGDVHLAQDVTQMVFTALSRDAARLARHPDLTGWLFTTTRFLAAKVVRTERRRHSREHDAWLAADVDDTAGEMPPRLRMVLDDVLMELQQLDREMLLMRFYRGLRLAEIGALINSSENAVQKRIQRALERLKGKLSQRGITSTAAAIALVLESHGAVAVPAGLAAAATTAGLACGAGGAGTLAVSGAATGSKFAFGLAAMLVLASSAALVWHLRENARLRTELAAETAARRAALERPVQLPMTIAAMPSITAPPVATREAPISDHGAETATTAPATVRLAAPARPVSGVAATAGDELVPLQIDYPKPLFAGTPRPLELPNLEPRATRRPDIMVPKSTALLSRGKPVTSSDPLPVLGDLSLVTDGDKTGADGTYVELGPGLQWIQIDLEESVEIRAIAVWHFHAQARVYHDVVVQLSDERDFKRGVVAVFNNDHDNSARLGRGRELAYVETNRGRLIDARGTRARYVRLYSNGSTSDELNHYCEVEVFGRPGK